jgi:hypothetical protein
MQIRLHNASLTEEKDYTALNPGNKFVYAD